MSTPIFKRRKVLARRTRGGTTSLQRVSGLHVESRLELLDASARLGKRGLVDRACRKRFRWLGGTHGGRAGSGDRLGAGAIDLALNGGREERIARERLGRTGLLDSGAICLVHTCGSRSLLTGGAIIVIAHRCTPPCRSGNARAHAERALALSLKLGYDRVLGIGRADDHKASAHVERLARLVGREARGAGDIGDDGRHIPAHREVRRRHGALYHGVHIRRERAIEVFGDATARDVRNCVDAGARLGAQKPENGLDVDARRSEQGVGQALSTKLGHRLLEFGTLGLGLGVPGTRPSTPITRRTSE